MGVDNSLDNIIVDVDDLIAVVRENMDDHREAYEDTLAGFLKAAGKALDEMVAKVARRELVNLRFTLPIPEDHTRDYERVLKLLEMTKDAGQDTVLLLENEQSMYVMDEWGWQKAFSQTSTFYSASS